MEMAKVMLCTNCGTQAKPKKIVKGSIGLEIILWMCFIVPGLIYSLWRPTSAARFKACPSCGAPDMVKLDSPIAKKMIGGTK